MVKKSGPEIQIQKYKMSSILVLKNHKNDPDSLSKQ